MLFSVSMNSIEPRSYDSLKWMSAFCMSCKHFYSSASPILQNVNWGRAHKLTYRFLYFV